MTRKAETVARYTVALDVLLQRGANLTAAARRDLALPNSLNLSAFGYDEKTLDLIDAAGEVVSAMPTDDEFVGILTEKTALKDQLAAQLREQISEIVARATTFYGAESGRVRRYGADKLSKMTDGQLWQCAKRTARVGQAQLADLAAKGLTAQHLNELIEASASFDQARDAQDDAIRERDIATQERVMAANAYYELLQKLAADGQAHFVARDEARYNDYVWEPNPETPAPDAGAGPPVPQP
jgi:hypothetical protein